jgi:hypothetical protein
LAYEDLNLILVLVGLGTSIAIPFILRMVSKRDTAMDKMQVENEKRDEEIIKRLDKYDERLRLAENDIIRTSTAMNRLNNRNGNSGR